MTASPSRLSVGVVITNRNTWELVSRCITAVQGVDAVDRFLVVDDASDSGPPSSLPEGAEVLINETNHGLCKSLNRGVAECATDIVVIFDSDAYPLRGFTDTLRSSFAGDPTIAVVGFPTVGTGGAATGSSEQEPDALGLILGQRLDALLRRHRGGSSPPESLSVFTCAMAVRREAFLALGGFDEAFDWLDLDHDLSMRFRRAGFRLVVHPALQAFHEGGGTPQRTADRVMRHYRNRWLLLRKHGKVRHPRLVGALIAGRLMVEVGILAPLRLIAPQRFADVWAGRWGALLHSGLFR